MATDKRKVGDGQIYDSESRPAPFAGNKHVTRLQNELILSHSFGSTPVEWGLDSDSQVSDVVRSAI